MFCTLYVGNPSKPYSVILNHTSNIRKLSIDPVSSNIMTFDITIDENLTDNIVRIHPYKAEVVVVDNKPLRK